jgi:RNA polymerase sigma-70 factor (ECF subfamily)
LGALEESAWSEHRERLMRFVLSRGVEPNDAEDIVHEVLAKALQPQGGPTDSSRLQQWLYQVVRHAMADHWRRKHPMETVPEDIPAGEEDHEGTPPADLLNCLSPFLARLGKEDADALRWADEAGLPQKDLARQMGLSLSGAKSRVQRARAKVLEMYRQCCSVELDRRGRLVDYVTTSCDTNCAPKAEPSIPSSPCSCTQTCQEPDALEKRS